MNANVPGLSAGPVTRQLETSPIATYSAPPANDRLGVVADLPSLDQPDLMDLILEASNIGTERPLASASVLLQPLLKQASKDAGARQDLNRLLVRTVTRVDRLISDQVNAILHHPRFQQLESSWRGLRFLLEQCDPEEGVRVKVLNVTWAELARDTDMALEFDQTTLFRKIYDEEFGMAGGEPFGVLIGDYQIRHTMDRNHSVDDLAVLSMISQVATAAFCPFIGGCDPALLGLDSFAQLENPLNLSRTFEQPEYLRWRAFRDTEEARFVGLTLPRVLMRLPHQEDLSDATFHFHEDVEAPGAANYLWGNAAWAFGSVLVRSFSQSHWLSDIRGVRRGEEGGGIVPGLPVQSFGTDTAGVADKFSTDVAVTDLQERSLTELGLIPLCPCKDTPFCAFYGNQSVQKPKAFTDINTAANAQVSAMLQHIFCASRIAHYLKIIGRDKIGTFKEPHELSNMLSTWLNKYTVDDANASPEVKARYPLRGADVTVREQPGKPGSYFCDMLLQPHSQWDELAIGIKLVTELAPARSA